MAAGQRIEFSKQEMRQLIAPLVIEQLLGFMVGLCDSIMVAQVGEAAVSAVSLVDTVNILLVNAFAALGTGGAVVAGQYLGRREADKASHSGEQLMLFMTEVSLVIMALFYLGKHFVLGTLFGQVDADVAAYANLYYLIVESSIPFLAIYSGGAALFRVMGNSGISMKVSAMMNVMNVAGNALLIFGFGMGVEGVAIPTLVSRMAAAAAMVILLRDPKLSVRVARLPLHHDGGVVKNIVRFGVPNGVENSMFQMGKILLLSTVSVLGTASVAANAVSSVLASIQCVPGHALGLAIVTVVSQCVGAGCIEEARYYTKKLVKQTYIWMFCVIVLVTVTMPPILNLYGLSAEAERYTWQIMWFHGIAAIFLWPLSFTLPQALRAAGDTRFTMVVSSVSMWLMRVGFGILFARYLGFGVVGTWLAMGLDWVLRVFFFVPRFLGHRWETMGLNE